MRITDAKTFVVGNPWKNWVFLKLETDEGIVGWSEATMGLSTRPAEAALHEMKPLYVGADPTRINELWDSIARALYLPASNVALTAMTAIEMACWDILGKSLGVPIHTLLGGAMRGRIRAYANGWYQGPREPSFFAERARALVERGYTGLKFDPFGSAYGHLDGGEEKRSLSLVRAVREAVSDEVDIMIEGHDRFAVTTAVRIGRALADYRPLWFEAPVNAFDIPATAEVARQIPVPVASGERFSTLAEFRDLLAPGVVGIIQPEMLHTGGFTGMRKIAGLAEAHGAWLAPHNAQSPLSTMVNVQVGATLPNLLIQECFDDSLVEWAREVVRGSVEIKDGYLEVPNRPGIGVEIDEQALLNYPYHEKNFLRLFDSGWERRAGDR
ncbi:MAG: mandelate racemase/muconate lactonizing enzyme family protein [Chloroflexi bacterium]|nr:mandelate racemase/muconate lactonizing enzyme family protein [Chloroflexota bacterium]